MKLPEAVAGGSALASTGGLLVLHPSSAVVFATTILQFLGYLAYRVTQLRLQQQSQQRAIHLVKAAGHAGFDGSLIIRADGQIELCSDGKRQEPAQPLCKPLATTAAPTAEHVRPRRPGLS